MKSIMALLVIAATAYAAPPPCSPQVFPVKFENEYVRICDNRLAAGAAEPVHTHSEDAIFLTFESQDSKEDMLGGPAPQRIITDGGNMAALEVLNPYTHRGVNTGKGELRLLVIELKKQRVGSPGTQKASGGAVIENSRVRVLRYTLAPGQSAPLHTHHRPYVIVTMNDMQLSMSDPQGRNFSHAVAAGDFHFQQPPVTHDLKNAGTTPGEVIEVELK